MRILVVDDETDTRDFLKATLQAECFAVDTASDGIEGSYMARTNEYDLIVLDHNMPKKSGLEVCRDIRAAGRHVPIIILSVRTHVDDKALALDSGADDYMTKPYSHQELVSRMRALLRRTYKVEPTIFSAGRVLLDAGSQEVKHDGADVYLTRKEFALLELLLRNKGKVVSRGTIMEHVWDMESDPLSKTIETHIVNLRKKLEKKREKLIYNIPGRGYKIKDD
ncbi:MAG TPA: response regulator transcription factor [Candidatus Paceibacterota bacterium]|nr:response regulator transcription factor [Candidatus Paceibacterota bacterium]